MSKPPDMKTILDGMDYIDLNRRMELNHNAAHYQKENTMSKKTQLPGTETTAKTQPVNGLPVGAFLDDGKLNMPEFHRNHAAALLARLRAQVGKTAQVLEENARLEAVLEAHNIDPKSGDRRDFDYALAG
jgi:hypothetical protein